MWHYISLLTLYASSRKVVRSSSAILGGCSNWKDCLEAKRNKVEDGGWHDRGEYGKLCSESGPVDRQASKKSRTRSKILFLRHVQLEHSLL
jgi:hypothetical protein